MSNGGAVVSGGGGGSAGVGRGGVVWNNTPGRPMTGPTPVPTGGPHYSQFIEMPRLMPQKQIHHRYDHAWAKQCIIPPIIGEYMPSVVLLSYLLSLFYYYS
jgi:hypothetical protein